MKVQEAIRKAQGFIAKQPLRGPQGAVAALAYVKSGGDRSILSIQGALRESVQKVSGGNYRPSAHHIYEASIDLMFFEAMDPKLYLPEMQAAANYIINEQKPNGAWYYPIPSEDDAGDTSITQYALIGLWAAVRVGIEVPTEVWERAVLWHIATQREDGGFAYHPFDANRPNHGPEEINTRDTMTAAGIGSLLIARRMLFGDSQIDSAISPLNSKPRFGVVERFVEEQPVAKRKVSLRSNVIDGALKNAIKWMVSHFGDIGKSKFHKIWTSYHWYSIERVSALLNVENFGSHDWYDEGCDELLPKQSASGSWMDESKELPATALCLLFLTKVTATIIKPTRKIATVGGGLQAGGRGLPDNLAYVEVSNGDVTVRKKGGAIDDLLVELERSSEAKVEDVQKAVVESVQLGRPEELIGQIDRLRKLAMDSRLEVRRTAIWALGRSEDITTVPLLIRGLSDPDLSVAREASLALCILSRRPDGCGIPIDLTNDSQMGIREGASEDDRKAILENWRSESTKRWTEWYQKYRPYDERDDRSSLKKTQ